MAAEIKLKLDFRNKVSISNQVQTEMRRLIQDGILQPGDQLPTVRLLAAQLKVNFNTIARAYRILDQEGLISTQQGRGTYVADIESADAISAEENPERTEKEWAEQLISSLIEKAGSQNISNDLLRQTFLQHIEKQPVHQVEQQKIKPNRRIVRKSQKKKFVYPPADDHGWVRLKVGPGRKKSRKMRIAKRHVQDSVSRETES